LNLAELGYLGLAAFLLIWCRFFSLLHGLKKRLNPSVLDKSLIFSAGIAILAMLFQELLNFSYRQLPVLLTVMYLCAMVSSIYNDYKNQSVKE
jgi:zinc transporter ZupT